MSKSVRANSYIESSAAYVEEEWAIYNDYFLGLEGIVYDLDDNRKLVEKARIAFDQEFMAKMMGVDKRYFCPRDLHSHDLIHKSAERALNRISLAPKSIRGIITTGVTSQHNFHTFPSHASMIQLHADLRQVKWAGDIATHQQSYKTAQHILRALNQHQEGIYIAVFSQTKDDLVRNPGFNTPLYGPVCAYVFLLPDKSMIHSDNLQGLNDPRKLEEKTWKNPQARLEEDYQSISHILRETLQKYKLDSNSVKGIILINQTQENSPDIPTNSHLQERLLGLWDLEVCCDLAMACAGTQGAFAIADAIIAERKEKMLVNSAETLEKIIDIYDTNGNINQGPMDANNPLFGTMATSFVVSPSPDGRGFIFFNGESNPFDGRYKCIFKDEKGYLRMPKGGRVLKEAITGMSSSIKEMVDFLESNGLQADNFSHLTHNANIRIVKGITSRLEKLGISGKIPENIGEISNTSSASCANLIVKEIPLEPNNTAYPTVAFGSGLIRTWALNYNMPMC